MNNAQEFNKNQVFDTISVDGHLYLLTAERIDRKTIPKGLFAYDVGGDDTISRVQNFVLSNHYGTIIGTHKLPLNKEGCYYPKYGSMEYEGFRYGSMDLETYLDTDPEALGVTDELKEVSEAMVCLPGQQYTISADYIADEADIPWIKEVIKEYLDEYGITIESSKSSINTDAGTISVSFDIVCPEMTRRHELHDILFCIPKRKEDDCVVYVCLDADT